jgi:hypothetical protein
MAYEGPRSDGSIVCLIIFFIIMVSASLAVFWYSKPYDLFFVFFPCLSQLTCSPILLLLFFFFGQMLQGEPA